MAANTPTSRKDTKEHEVGDWLRWLTTERRLASDQCGVKCVMLWATLWDMTQSKVILPNHKWKWPMLAKYISTIVIF